MMSLEMWLHDVINRDPKSPWKSDDVIYRNTSLWQSWEAFQEGSSSNYSENSLKILSVHVANASLIRTNAKNGKSLDLCY